MSKKKPYNDRSDLNRIASQWTKLRGHHTREDWSAAVVRAATAAEIAVNLALREEFRVHSDFQVAFVDSLLRWANGLSGKLQKLLLPLLQDQPKHVALRKLCKLANTITDKRNKIVHRGEFCSQKESTELIQKCHKFVVELVRLYEPAFSLPDPPSQKD